MSRHAWRQSAGARALTIAAIVLLAAPTLLRAQVAAPSAVVARPGELVRVRTQEWEYTGTLARMSGDTAIIRFAADSAFVARLSVRRVQVQRGTRRSTTRVVIGSAIGLATGALVGAYTGVLLECGSSCGDEGVFGGVAGGVLGTGIGGLAGAITGGVIGGRKRYPRWVPAMLP